MKPENASLEFFLSTSGFISSISHVHWMNDNLHYTELSGSVIVMVDPETGNRNTILSLKDVDLSNYLEKKVLITGYSFSSDEKLILFSTAKKKIYRRSFMSNFYIYNRESNSLEPLSKKGKQKCPQFSPDGKNIAFIRNNNIFIYNIEDKTEYQITSDGKKNHIINGETDWVYEEEFEFTRAYEWSPDGKSLVYLKFNESKVPNYTLQYFSKSTQEDPYPVSFKYKYPKAGQKNSIVTIHAYNLETKNTLELKVDDQTDIYIPKIMFTKNPQIVSIFHLNRHQNKFTLFLANILNGEVTIMYQETNKYYISSKFFEDFYFIEDNKLLFSSEESGYKHMYIINIDGTGKKQITSGDYDIEEIFGYSPEHKEFYYSSFEESPLELYAYAITEDGHKSKLTPTKGWNKVTFSNDFNYIIIEFSDANTIPTTSLYNRNGELLRILEDNKALSFILCFNFTTKEFIKIPLFNEKEEIEVELDACIMKPPNSQNIKSPVIIFQYSGPESKQVKNSFSYNWQYYLVAKGFIVITIDPRGTAGHGQEFRKCTYLNLGKIESDDIVRAAEYISKLDYVDERKIGIFGWSYGGFMVLSCLSKSSIINTGVAVAPVTNWRLYDSIYTERYMRTPQENPDGYDLNSPTSMVELMTSHQVDKNILICHGTADDNVHIQNTYLYTEALVQSNIKFDMAIYTDRNHGIYGGNTTLHLYTRFVNHFMKYLKDEK